MIRFIKLSDKDPKANKRDIKIVFEGDKYQESKFFKFTLYSTNIKNKFDKLSNFVLNFAENHPEYEDYLLQTCEYYHNQKYDKYLENIKNIYKFGEIYVQEKNIDIASYCDISKNKVQKLFIDEKMMKELLESIATAKLSFFFLAEVSALSNILHDKFLYALYHKIYDNRFFDLLYDTIRQTSFKFSLTDKAVFALLSVKYGDKNIAYTLQLFNAFIHQFICTYDFELGKNPMTYIKSVINSSFTWLIKMNYNDVNVIDEENEIYYEQDVVINNLHEMIMNEEMFNNHVLFGLRYIFDNNTIKRLLKNTETMKVTSVMNTIGNMIISRMTGVSLKFLNKRKSSYTILNNLFLSKFLEKIYPDSTYFKKLALLLRVRPNMAKLTTRKRRIDKNFFKNILDRNITLYGINDVTIITEMIQQIIIDLEYPVIDIIDERPIKLPNDFLEIILDTIEKLNNENDKDFKFLRMAFLTIVQVDNTHINSRLVNQVSVTDYLVKDEKTNEYKLPKAKVIEKKKDIIIKKIKNEENENEIEESINEIKTINEEAKEIQMRKNKNVDSFEIVI